MTGDTIECFNCGHANPSWAQVCRSCGYPILASGPSAGAQAGIFPTDQASLTSIGATLGAIVLAIVVGLVFSGWIPPAPNVAEETPTPSPSASATASGSASATEIASPSVAATPALPGTITFGTGWNNTTRKITGETTTFTAASTGFAHSISLSAPLGVDRLQEEVVRVAADGGETVVQTQKDGTVFVNSSLKTDGLRSPASMTKLYRAWGKGVHILRIYRGGVLIAEGTFTFS
jgi:hypothetical protein